MPNWRDKSARFQENMRQLNASEEFSDATDFEPAQQLNPFAEQVQMVQFLSQIIDGMQRGEYLLQNGNVSLALDDFSSARRMDVRGGVPVLASNGALLELNLTLRVIGNDSTVDDPYPDAAGPTRNDLKPRAQVGASPARQLILDDDE